MDKKIKTWSLRFPSKENPNMEKALFDWPIGQSCCSMTSKRSIGWFLESSRAWSFFTRAFAKPTKSRARLYPFDKPIKSLYFRSFLVSVLFARFHFKVIRKLLYECIIYVRQRSKFPWSPVQTDATLLNKRSKIFIFCSLTSFLKSSIVLYLASRFLRSGSTSNLVFP